MSNKLWEDIFFYGILSWLFIYFGIFYLLRWHFRRKGKSARNLELKVGICTFVPMFTFLMLTAPGVPIWAKTILIISSVAVPIIAWKGYVRYFNTIRRSLGLREWDWDWGGPKRNKGETTKDNSKDSIENGGK